MFLSPMITFLYSKFIFTLIPYLTINKVELHYSCLFLIKQTFLRLLKLNAILATA